jgi:hypothetical protein
MGYWQVEGTSATYPAMTFVRAAYSYWYFTTGSRWQPEGRV